MDRKPLDFAEAFLLLVSEDGRPEFPDAFFARSSLRDRVDLLVAAFLLDGVIIVFLRFPCVAIATGNLVIPEADHHAIRIVRVGQGVDQVDDAFDDLEEQDILGCFGAAELFDKIEQRGRTTHQGRNDWQRIGNRIEGFANRPGDLLHLFQDRTREFRNERTQIQPHIGQHHVGRSAKSALLDPRWSG